MLLSRGSYPRLKFILVSGLKVCILYGFYVIRHTVYVLGKEDNTKLLLQKIARGATSAAILNGIANVVVEPIYSARLPRFAAVKARQINNLYKIIK
jgi:uncharacterized membrane protein